MRHTEERFVCEYVLNCSRTLDVVQQERLRYEVEQKSKYITASLYYLGQLHLREIYAYLLKKEIGVVGLIIVKIYFHLLFIFGSEIIILLLTNGMSVIKWLWPGCQTASAKGELSRVQRLA